MWLIIQAVENMFYKHVKWTFSEFFNEPHRTVQYMARHKKF